MKTFGLVLALVMVVAGSSVAQTGTANYDVYTQFNLVTAPLVPLDPDPVSVFAGVGLEWYSSTLNRFDSPTQTMTDYDPYDPARFGNVLLGDGYWLYCDANYTISYTGVADGVPDASSNMTDMWISLPGDQTDGADAGGWNLIGQPFDHATPFGSDEWSGLGDFILVTDGTQVLTIEQADAAGWINGTFNYFDGTTQTMYNAGYFYADDYYLRSGKGYWVLTKKDNLALIIPAGQP